MPMPRRLDEFSAEEHDSFPRLFDWYHFAYFLDLVSGAKILLISLMYEIYPYNTYCCYVIVQAGRLRC